MFNPSREQTQSNECQSWAGNVSPRRASSRNMIYLPHDEHKLADEEAFNSIELIKEVIIYVLGSEVLK